MQKWMNCRELPAKKRYIDLQVPTYDLCLKKVGIRPGEGDSWKARSSRLDWIRSKVASLIQTMTLRSECFFYPNECLGHLSNFV